MSDKIRVLLADDHTVLRSGLRALLNQEPDMEVVGEAVNGREAIEMAQALKPDVIVLDISIPEIDGMEAAQRIQRLGLPTHVVMLTMHTEDRYLFETLRTGASGYVLKSSSDKDLTEAIRTVHRGDVFLYPSALTRILGEYLKGARGDRQGNGSLTGREEEVLKLTAKGYTNHEIAARLAISPKTVDTYRQRIMEKLNLRHRADLVRYALRKGLLTADE